MTIEKRFFTESPPFREWYRLLLRARGFNDFESSATADWAVYTASYGIKTHGPRKLQHLIDDEFKRSGSCVPNVQHTVLSSFGGLEIWDANYQLGPVVAQLAQERAAVLAETHGFGLVVVRKANHFGWGPAYALQTLTDTLLTGNFCQGAIPIVVPIAGTKATLGSNAICLAMNTFNIFSPTYVWDTGIAATNWGAVQLALATGQLLPPGCGIDADGKETLDPKLIVALLAAGSIGNALGIFVELFSANAGASDPQFRSAAPEKVPSGESPGCVFAHFALNLEPFDRLKFEHDRSRRDNLAAMVDAVLFENGTARMPGDRKFAELILSESHGGLFFDEASVHEFRTLADRFQVPLVSEFRTIDVEVTPVAVAGK